jgi:hypothetical protein
METRSQTRLLKNQETLVLELEVNIDFDGASRAWKENKKYMGNGTYKYICSNLKKDGKICGKSCYKSSDQCWHHNKMRTRI